MIADTDRSRLLAIARQAIAASLGAAPPPDASAMHAGALETPAGAFVSLHVKGELRGCIGHLEPDSIARGDRRVVRGQRRERRPALSTAHGS
ncbi:MAG: AMMECR1 domain-containing protein [Vicinamibacterales bacterium]